MSFSHCTFCADRKYQRTRHRVKIVAMFFAQELLCNIHRSNIACRLSLFVSVQALRDLCGYSVIKENITLPHFKHFLAYSWTETGFHSIFNSAVILGITYAYGKPRTIVILKRKPAPLRLHKKNSDGEFCSPSPYLLNLTVTNYFFNDSSALPWGSISSANI